MREGEEGSAHELDEVIAGVIPTNFVDYLLRHWVTVEESLKNG